MRFSRRSFAASALTVATLLSPGLMSGAAWAGADDIRFTATLSADEQSAPTYSDAKGFAELTLERETLKVTWKITYEGLSGPAKSAGLFGPDNPGGNAGQIVDIGVNGLNSPITGSAILTDGQFQYLITGRVYANILTAKWPLGELRGQFRRQRKNAPAVTQ